jgi:transcriptional regulator with GAF, ATPase, and Fis domain
VITQKLKPIEKLKEAKAFVSLVGAPTIPAREMGEMLTIGRAEGNHLVVSDPFASGRHARIEWHKDGYLVRDLNSRNGTYLNGARVMMAPLSDKDRIRVGGAELIFLLERDHRGEQILLTSKNADWNQKLKAIGDMAQSELPILIGGASGTGKEILAQQLHRQSHRREGPFVSVNCSALSESLAESELFGHTKGSFTDATHDRKGAFECARGGTLFLDEIGDLPISLQPKLLRALENREIRPVGSDRTVKTDVRIVAATHHNLKQQVIEGLFRADLFFRQHSWPGNIRELKNVVARGLPLCQGKVNAEDVSRLIDRFPTPTLPKTPASPFGGGSSTGNILKDLERTLIERRLVANKGNQRQTALDLGVPKSTLHDRIRNYQIDIEQLIADHQ